MSKINFAGIFSHYQPINFEPYYVCTTTAKFWQFLIKCKDYPEFISKLSPDDLVNIEAEKGKETDFGTLLVNVKLGEIK